VRGKRISKKIINLDVVLEAVRYEQATSRLLSARGYKRIGSVWSDKLLFDRKQIIEWVKSKKRIVCGRPAIIPGDFEVFGRLQYLGNETLTCDGGSSTNKEDLGLPLF
jgi:hypothetical protein